MTFFILGYIAAASLFLTSDRSKVTSSYANNLSWQLSFCLLRLGLSSLMKSASASLRFRRSAQLVARISKVLSLAFGCFVWLECLYIQESLSLPPCSSVRMILRLAVSPMYESVHFLFSHTCLQIKLLRCCPSILSLMLIFFDIFARVWTILHLIFSCV